MLKRIALILLFIPLAFAQTFIQLPFLIIRWLFTGKAILDTEPWMATIYDPE